MKLFVFLLATLALAAGTQAAAYIKFDGVDGECQVSHGLGDWPWQVSMASMASVQHPFVIKKQIDKATPKLMLSVINASPLAGPVEITICSGPGTFAECSRAGYGLLKATLTGARVTGMLFNDIDPSTAETGSRPTEQFSLNFEEIKYEVNNALVT